MFALVALLALAAEALGHSPYLTDVTTWTGPDGKRLQIGFINGDGIIGFGPDPMRPVVLDEAGKVVAVGPRTSGGIVWCHPKSGCTVLQSNILPIKVHPDPSTFRATREPDFYPEYENEEYGFTWDLASPLDYIAIFVGAICKYPVELGIAAFLGIVCAGVSIIWRQSMLWPDRRIGRTLIVLSSLMIWGFSALILLLYPLSGNWLLFAPAYVVFASPVIAARWLWTPHTKTAPGI